MNQSLIIPPFILIIYLLSIYAIPVRQHIQFLLKSHPNASIAFLTLFFLSYILSLSSYLRALITVNTNPGSIPLDAKRSHESFFLLDTYVCEPDGRPKWCYECQQRKPDRAHHSHKLGRCIAKMDHECPWVGGVVSQTSFNFFLQFTFYTFILCAITFSSSLYTLSLQLPHKDPWVIISIVLSGLFGGFTGSMTLTVLRFVFTNYTLIEFRRRRDTKHLAVRISPDTPQSEYPTMTFPSDHGESKFAILEVGPTQNVWDLGYWRNWKSVMGNEPLRWFLPIWHSPCCETKTEALDYPLGDVVENLKRKYKLIDEPAA